MGYQLVDGVVFSVGTVGVNPAGQQSSGIDSGEKVERRRVGCVRGHQTARA